MMRWKSWKRGLLVAMFTGSLTGIVGIAIGITWQQCCILLAVSVAKETLMWLKQHPVDQVKDTTQFLRRDTVPGRKPDDLAA